MKLLIGLVALLYTTFPSYSSASLGCDSFLALTQEVKPLKIVEKINELNPEILFEGMDVTNASEVYLALKIEESRWYKNWYLDLGKTLDEEGEKRVRSLFTRRFKNESEMTREDFKRVYLNQLRLFYIQASKAMVLSIVKGMKIDLESKYKPFFQKLVRDLFGADLDDSISKPEEVKEILGERPWENYPADKVIKAFQLFEKTQPRSVHDITPAVMSSLGFNVDSFQVLFSAWRNLKRKSKKCCGNGVGCLSCPLNKAFLLP